MFYFHSQCGSTADVKSYRPISNLSVVSKLLEQLVSSQLVKYLKLLVSFGMYDMSDVTARHHLNNYLLHFSILSYRYS